MYTQLADNLAALFQSVGKPQDAQLALQSFANCWQALRTNGPLSLTGTNKPPRGGVITNYPNEGSGQWGQYPGNAWNPQNPTAPPTGDGNYWGGDTYYGDTNLTNNFVTNLGDWYQKTFVDSSYNDFSTLLNTTTNSYNQQINNFAGDNYFTNSTVTNNTVNNNVTNQGDVINEGDVINQGDTINEGDVINQGDTFLTQNTFITDGDGNPVKIDQFIINLIVNLIFGGGGGNNPQPPRPPLPPLIGKGKIKLPKYTLNAADCSITPDAKEVEVTVEVAPAR